MRLLPTLPGKVLLVLGLVLLFGAARLVSTQLSVGTPAQAAVQHSQSLAPDSEGGAVQKGEPAKAEGGKTAGNGASGSGRTEAILVIEVLALLVVGRILGELMQRLGQPALMGPLLAGIVLGPSLFGWLWPEAQHFLFPKDETQKGMIDGLSQMGILMLLLLTGMETDPKLVRKSGFAAIAITLCGIAFPFACGFALGWYGPGALFDNRVDRLVPALFLGTALSISSIKIVAMVVREMNFMRRNLGQVIVTTAIMEDTVGWVIIAVTFGIAGASGANGAGAGLDWLEIGKTVGGVALFLVFCFTAGRWLVFSAIRWANDNFRSDFPVISVILAIMLVFAGVTHLLGVRTVLGAFMAGVLIGESPILTDHIQSQLRGMITAFFMPIFFGMSGLAADLTILRDGNLAMLTVLLVVIASIGKFSGAFAGAMLGRLSGREGLALGCAMNARGSTEVIVASIGLSMGALSQNLYTMIVTMAVLTTMAMPPMLRVALRGLPMSKDEEVRITRETMDEKGFLPRLERLLLAADDSAVGRMAARLAGLVAGAQGMPVTILKLSGDVKGEKAQEPEKKDPTRDSGDDKPGEKEHSEQFETKDSAPKVLAGAQSRVESGAELKADPLAREVKAGAKKSAAKVIADDAEPNPEKVHLTARVPVDAPGEVVKDEARKGYDMMFIGLADSVEDDGGFIPAVTELSAGFEGPLAVYANEGAGLTGKSRILVPVNGSPQSRHGAEIAFALARATGAKVHVLFVSQTDGRSRTRLREERVLKEMADLGERYDVRASTRISPRAAADEAILKEGRNSAMIVMGVSARPGEELFFGNTATQVLKGWKSPILLVAS